MLDFLAETGDADNTIVVAVSDNGASAEGGATGSINDVRLLNLDPASTDEMFARLADIGGPLTHNNYPWGWTMAGNTPFRRWKREVHEGGVADPCIISWPGAPGEGIDSGGIRHQFTHAIDIVPTVAELAGLDLPAAIEGIEQSRVDGLSFAYLLGRGGENAAERHQTQYFEMFGSRAIYHRGWKAVTFHPVGPLYDDQDPNAPFDEDTWELYHVAEDLSESRDLAARYPDLLAEMIELWWAEAARHQVLPLDNRVLWALVHPKHGAGAGLTCGYEWGPAIGSGYAAPFPFAGTIRRAYVETMGPAVRDPLAELEAILSEQ
ncbi:MAG: sulfatase-like hydrolase/transferase [Streptosporangiaceae bacterium]|nr:sulfatase-like hydrolase/transferase [Streptosporangiaceae bacterium]